MTKLKLFCFVFLLDYLLLIQMMKNTGVNFLHQSYYTFARKALFPIKEKIILNYNFFFPLREVNFLNACNTHLLALCIL